MPKYIALYLDLHCFRLEVMQDGTESKARAETQGQISDLDTSVARGHVLAPGKEVLSRLWGHLRFSQISDNFVVVVVIVVRTVTEMQKNVVRVCIDVRLIASLNRFWWWYPSSSTVFIAIQWTQRVLDVNSPPPSLISINRNIFGVNGSVCQCWAVDWEPTDLQMVV